MKNSLTLDSVLDKTRQLIEAGAALHWLVPKDKMPVEKQWTSVPRYSESELRKAHRIGNNIGIRTGKPSQVESLYIHVLDIDIRNAAKAAEAWTAVSELLPNHRQLPSVISGSGGESRHLYFLCSTPFGSKILRKSDSFEFVFDPKKDRKVKKHDWQLELKGTGTQVVLPPSIHPDTGQPYRWEREFELDLPFLYEVEEAKVANWGVRSSVAIDDDDDDLFSIVRKEPLGLDEVSIRKVLSEIPNNDQVDYDDYLQAGMAIHHETGGSDEGFEIWREWAEQSPKFDIKDLKHRWKSFAKRDQKHPVRMATLIQAANNHRLATELDLDVEDDFAAPAVTSSTDLSDLLESSSPEPEKINDLTRPDPNWTQKLHRNEEGELKTTLPNIALIVENDPRTRGIVAFNEFTQEIALKNPPKQAKKKRDSSHLPVNLTGRLWSVSDRLNGDNWTDSHDSAVRALIESKSQLQGYGIKVSDRDLRSAVDMCAQKLPFHPVQELLLSEKWDGVPRAERMFIEYLGTEDNPYYRQAALLTLVGAVARVFRPGCKFDFVPILEGIQGKGKSTFIKILGLHWMRELQGDVDDAKQMVEAMQGSWILEIGELSAMHRSEVNALKAFVSRQVDKVRLAWEKRARDFPRQCIFIGSTNDREYLRDQSGGRRFWPIVCEIEGQIDNPKLQRNVMQIWAEAVHIFKTMAAEHSFDLPLYMTDEAAILAVEMQESRRVETAEEILSGRIQFWLDRPIGDEFDDLDPDTPKLLRQETCITEIWREVLGKEGEPPQMETMRIGRAMQFIGWPRTKGPVLTREINKKYGKCRVYVRPEEIDPA